MKQSGQTSGGNNKFDDLLYNTKNSIAIAWLNFVLVLHYIYYHIIYLMMHWEIGIIHQNQHPLPNISPCSPQTIISPDFNQHCDLGSLNPIIVPSGLPSSILGIADIV